MPYCIKCGAPLQENGNFCPNCGARLAGAEVLGGEDTPAFKDGGTICLMTFFLLGNYFALFGLKSARLASLAYYEKDLSAAASLKKRALFWALWGLIPSTIINALLIYGLIKLMSPFLSGLASLGNYPNGF